MRAAPAKDKEMTISYQPYTQTHYGDSRSETFCFGVILDKLLRKLHVQTESHAIWCLYAVIVR